MGEDFRRLVDATSRDSGVLGLLLGGSRGKGLGTELSDWDVYVVVAGDGDAIRLSGMPLWESPELDLCGVYTLEQFEQHASIGDVYEWNRYTFAHVVPIFDKTRDRVLQALCDEKEWLPLDLARARGNLLLDAYLNSYYRALKNTRDGNHLAAALDAAEAVPLLLEFAFTAERRVRPYNKFLAWELTTHPLTHEFWPTSEAIELLSRVVREVDLAAMALIFRNLERAARAADFSDTLDAWGPVALQAFARGAIE